MAMESYSLPHLQFRNDIKLPIGSVPIGELEWDLTGIAAIDPLIVWVVGNVRRPEESPLYATKGVIVASTDGGQTWEIRHTEPGKYFSDVHFVDRFTGWVADASDLLLKTTDSGRTWAKQIAPAKAYWAEIQFLDYDQGWVLGTKGQILRTDSGGEKWKLIRVDALGDFFFLRFADSKNGWIVGEGVAYETIDSGLHWRSRGDDLRRLLPDWTDCEVSFRMVKFIDTNVGFIAADVLSKRGTSNAIAVVFKTVDRGRTWTTSIIPEALGIRSAEFLSDKQAWIIPGNKANAVVRHTNDGGLTWSSLRLPRNSLPGRLLFVDSKHGWFLNGSHTHNSDELFRTENGGRTWIELRISERIGNN